MDIAVATVFGLVYFGMILGNLPGLALDRTGIALLGAIAMIVLHELSLQEAVLAVDLSAITLLFSFMILSAQFYYSGFYTYLAERVRSWEISPPLLLGVVILMAALLSAVLINDIVCLAMTPLLVKIAVDKRLNPVPYLLGLMFASNIGSAVTLIGNPQNMLIGQAFKMPFAVYSLYALVPCILGGFVVWGIIAWQTRGKWEQKNDEVQLTTYPFLRWQSLKGVIAIVALLVIFLFTDLPRTHVALIFAGLLLLSRQMASQTMLSFIDWQLLVLFIGLFIVNHELNNTNLMASFVSSAEASQINLSSQLWIFIAAVILSNIVSNAPAVMLLLPFVKTTAAAAVLALSSTFAGNLFIVASIANIIVIAQAAKLGIRISWRRHLMSGIPIGVITLVIAALWSYLWQIYNGNL